MRGSLKVVVLGSVAIMGFAHLPSMTGIERFAFVASAHAEDVTLTNVTFGFKGFTTYRAPSVTFKNPNLDKAALQKLFDGKAETNTVEVLAGLSADAIVFPELTQTEVETTMRGDLQTRTLVYKDLTLGQIEKGRARTVSSKGIGLKLEGENKNKTTVVKARGTMESLDIANLDLAYSVRVVTTTAPLTSSELRPIFERYRLGNIKVRYEEIDIAFGSLSITNLKMRPLETMSFAAFSDPSFRPDADDASSEDERKGLQVTAELFESIDFDTMDIQGMSVKGPAMGSGGRMTSNLSFEIGKTIIVPGKIAFENMVYTFPSLYLPDRMQTFKMGALKIAGLSFKPTIAALKAAAGFKHMDEAFENPQVLQKLIPDLGTWRVENLAFEHSGEDDKTAHYGIESVELAVKEQTNGIPTAVKFSIDGLSANEAAVGTEWGKQIWVPLGVTRLDLSHNFEYAWDAKTQKIHVKDLSVDIKQVGNARLSGDIGNVPSSLFAFTEESLDALMATTFAKAALEVEDYGIIGKYVAMKAESEKQKPEAVRSQLAIQTEAMSVIFLGSGETSRALGRAIAGFISKGKLKAEFSPKNSRELSVFDLFMEEDFAQALESVSVKIH